MKRKIVIWGSAVVALLFAFSAFSVSANMCWDPGWAAFHADGGMYENECDIEAEWIAGYYAAQAAGTFSNDGSHSLEDFVVVKSKATSQLIIERVDGTNPVVRLNGGRLGPYPESMGINGATVKYRLSVSEHNGVLTIHYNRKKVEGRTHGAANGVAKATFRVTG